MQVGQYWLSPGTLNQYPLTNCLPFSYAKNSEKLVIDAPLAFVLSPPRIKIFGLELFACLEPDESSASKEVMSDWSDCDWITIASAPTAIFPNKLLHSRVCARKGELGSMASERSRAGVTT